MILFIISFITGVAASMGLGGGFILLLYLTVFENTPQLQAQGMNLIFFIPVAAVSLIFHVKNKLVEKKVLLPALLCGAVGVGAGVLITKFCDQGILSKIFGVMVLFVGVRELFHKKKNDKHTG